MRRIIRGFYEWSKLILFAVAAAFFIKNTVAASAFVPTGSMEQTVEIGSRIMINRLAYLCESPQRGDIVSFYYPDDGKTLYLKRIIGLPGEVIEGVDGRVYIDGNVISDYTDNPFYEDFGPYNIPENCYFMMGDNRSNSWDSRYWKNRFVAFEDIIGKAEFAYYPEIKVLR
ncbi:MAG: signal peptidase I [Lachnospiraceae bacterium]|nr:signal peptidase I [Lachnospiraceae bacterium]